MSIAHEITSIFAQAFYAIGDTVWFCHDLTSLRLNFPKAVIKTEPPFPGWSGYTLIAPELKVEFGTFDEAEWDFTLYNYGDDLSHRFRGGDIVYWKHPKLFKGKNVEAPVMHLLEARQQQLQTLFPGFARFSAPTMPDIKPYPSFPVDFDRRPIVSIQTGTSRDEKTYDIKNWETVAKQLCTKGFNVVYIGGPSDPLPSYTNDRMINMVGKTNIQSYVSVIRSSAVHLACDTGAGHIAAAYRVPVVSLFGGFSFPASSKPYGDDKRIRVIESCADENHPKPNMCPAAVVEAAEALYAMHHPCAGKDGGARAEIFAP